MTAIAVASVIIPLSSSLAPLFPSTYYSLSTSSQAYSMLWAEKKKRGWRLSMQDNDHVYNENINNSKEKVLQYPHQQRQQDAITKILKSDKTNTNSKWMISELSSREILKSFEDVMQQQKQPRKMTMGRRQVENNRYENDIDELLNSMVDDLVLTFNNCNDNDQQQQQQQRISECIKPRDASSIIRLLGQRPNVHTSMIQFCRTYCHDIYNNSILEQQQQQQGEQPIPTSAAATTTAAAQDAIMYAYSAVIAAIAKPPILVKTRKRDLSKALSSSSMLLQTEKRKGRHSQDKASSTTNNNDNNNNKSILTTSNYRNSTYLTSLLSEMKDMYNICTPNSYILSGILLGIDDMIESIALLNKFEQQYSASSSSNNNNNNNNNNYVLEQPILTVHVYNVVIATCSKGINNDNDNNNNNGWQCALSILRRMIQHGPEPNEQTYAHVLGACATAGQIHVAFSLLDSVLHGNGDGSSSSSSSNKVIRPITAQLCLPLLKAFANAGDNARAKLIINMMNDNPLMTNNSTIATTPSAITTEMMNLYLLSLARNNDIHHNHPMEALVVLKGMITNGPSPDIVSYNTVLLVYANAGDYNGARDLLDRMTNGIDDTILSSSTTNSNIIRPDVISYNTVLLCASPHDALSLIQEMKLTRRNRVGIIRPNSITYVNAITQCRKTSIIGDIDPRIAFDIAIYLLNMARKEEDFGITLLNVYVYSSVIWIAEAVNDYRTAVQVLREMKKCTPPNAICYDGVISVLSKQGYHREALYMYYEMQSKELSATRKTYCRLVYAVTNSIDIELSHTKKIALLEGILTKMPIHDRNVRVGGPLFESIIRYHGTVTNSRTVYQAARRVFDMIAEPVDDACLSAMLRVCSLAEPVMWKEALDIVRMLPRPGLVSTRALSYAVIACAKADQYKEALNLIDLYGGLHDKLVSVRTINAVISACGRGYRPDMAVQILNDMETMYGVKPDETSYRSAIIACNQAEHRERINQQNTSTGYELKWWECALSLLRRMKEDDMKPSVQTVSSVVSACEAAGEWQHALGVLASMFPLLFLDGSILPIPMFPLLDGVEQMGKTEPPNLFCLNAAISACEKGGRWVEALQLYENIRSMNSVKPNFITVNSLLIALVRAKQTALAESIYRNAVKEKIVLPWKRRYDNDGKLKTMMVRPNYCALFLLFQV
jgi:pentatricopeptide repeat protein